MSLTLFGFLSALLIGLSVGFVLQRGRGCTNTAFRNLLLTKNSELATMIVVVVCIELIGYFILSLGIFGFVFVSNPLPLSYILIPLGGFIFGLGMVIAGGCAGGVCYRIGEGSASSLLALLGFATGIGIFVLPFLNNGVSDLRNNTLITIDGSNIMLTHFLPRWFWTLLAIFLLIIVIYRYYQKKLQLTHLLDNWNPIKTGIFIGILGVLARYFSTLNGREFGLSTTDGIAEIVQTTFLFQPIGWAGVFIITLILGSAFSSYRIGELKLSMPNKEGIFRYFGGGVLLGVGAMLGTGCNFGHIFGGIPELGFSSFVAVIFMLLGNWIGSYYYYIKLENKFPQSTPIPS